MGTTKRKRKRRRRQNGRQKKRGGVLLGMRGGFKGIANSVTGNDTQGKYKWWGRIITLLLLAVAVGLLVNRL